MWRMVGTVRLYRLTHATRMVRRMWRKVGTPAALYPPIALVPPNCRGVRGGNPKQILTYTAVAFRSR
jgi:hypothetical protein